MGNLTSTVSVRKSLKLSLLLLLIAGAAYAGVNVISDASVAAQKWFINAYGSGYVVQGKPDVQSYIVAVSNQAYTASEGAIDLEAEAGRGFRITKVCIQPGSATAAAWVQWQLIRTTTASSAGTVIAAEATSGNVSLAKMDPGDSNWSGVARTAATEGTSGAILDTGNAFVAITVTPPAAYPYFCREYGIVDGKQPVVAAGTTNGVKLMWEGTAGGADFAAQIHFVAN
jgi:hypothetical protein